jgi:hypothetical protein
VPIDRFDNNILGFQAVSHSLVGQVRNSQMDRGNPCQAGIVRVQGGRHGRKTRQEPIDRQVFSVGAA